MDLTVGQAPPGEQCAGGLVGQHESAPESADQFKTRIRTLLWRQRVNNPLARSGSQKADIGVEDAIPSNQSQGRQRQSRHAPTQSSLPSRRENLVRIPPAVSVGWERIRIKCGHSFRLCHSRNIEQKNQNTTAKKQPSPRSAALEGVLQRGSPDRVCRTEAHCFPQMAEALVPSSRLIQK